MRAACGFYNRVQPSLFIAIDPGASGAYVIRRPDGVIAEVGEYGEPKDVVKVCAFLRANNLSVFPIVAVIERVWGSPVMGVSAAFAFGENYGGWCMAMRHLRRPLHHGRARMWCCTTPRWTVTLLTLWAGRPSVCVLGRCFSR